MQIVRTVAKLRKALAGWRSAGAGIALVPTMGALHAGHLALIEAAQAAYDRVVATIFVNPRQFAAGEDLAAYPRSESADLDLLRAAGTDLVFVPAVEEIYPPQFSTLVRVNGLSENLCGADRPAHFDGVATVVTKLLIQALPDAAYFGEKDYQQLLVIRRLARDLDIPVQIQAVPTVREPDGLALSSRNLYLSPAERRVAPVLARVLREIATALKREPLRIEEARKYGLAELAGAGFRVEYLEICDAETLAPVTKAVSAPSRVLAAAHLGRTRLIDNFPILSPRSA